jgi:hypothetical protein
MYGFAGMSAAASSDLSKVVIGSTFIVAYYELQGSAYVSRQTITGSTVRFGMDGLALTADGLRMFVADLNVPKNQTTNDMIGTVYVYQLNPATDQFGLVPNGQLLPTGNLPSFRLGFGFDISVTEDGSRLLIGGEGDDGYTGWLNIPP